MKASILIIDDDKIACDRFKEIIKKKFHTLSVIMSHTKKEAKEVISSTDFNVILTDMRLPYNMEDGYELIKFIKIRSPQTLVIAFTAFREINIGLKCISAGCVNYIDKSNDDELMDATIRAIEYSESSNDKNSLSERFILSEWGELTLKKGTFELGEALENLCFLLFKTIPGWDKIKVRERSRTEEIDLVIKNESLDETWKRFGTIIQVECKYWLSNKKPGKNEFVSFYNKICSRNKQDCRLGFFISVNGFASTFLIELDKIYKEEIKIVPIHLETLWKLICAPNRNEYLKDLVINQMFN